MPADTTTELCTTGLTLPGQAIRGRVPRMPGRAAGYSAATTSTETIGSTSG